MALFLFLLAENLAHATYLIETLYRTGYSRLNELNFNALSEKLRTTKDSRGAAQLVSMLRKIEYKWLDKIDSNIIYDLIQSFADSYPD